MKILLHACCAPCSLMPVKILTERGNSVIPYFYNPNIHPYMEYKRRLDAFCDYYGEGNYELLDDYAMEEFLAAVAGDYGSRCSHCYTVRLESAAKKAAAEGYDAFSTSLLISPYQNHELICRVGEEMAEKYGVNFYYEDFRPIFREGQNIAREEGIYRQPYCGCIYSEKERYFKENKK